MSSPSIDEQQNKSSKSGILLSDPVSALSGVGPKKSKILRDAGISNVRDLLECVPRRYEDRRNVTPVRDAAPGSSCLIEVRVASRRFSGYRYKKNAPLTLLVTDDTANIEIVFFNGSYISNFFVVGQEYVFYGKVTVNSGRKQMVHPEFHRKGDKGDIRGIVPVYREIQGVSGAELRKLIAQALPAVNDAEEWIPEEIVRNERLCSPAYALENIHFPDEERKIKQAQYRMVFEELFVLETGLLYSRQGAEKITGGISIDPAPAEEFRSSLGFAFTSGQERTWDEIAADLRSPKPMNRLVQGDVGSGKTAVAETAMYACVRSGFQAVMMAPTEILAKQHFDTLTKDYAPFGIKVGLLTGSLTPAERRDTLRRMASGELEVIVGTHALIQPDVEYKALGLVVTDEQHRFGVAQRRELAEKGDHPNVMVMTATPIPRTIAVILYGDLDISVIDTMPAGRKPILTKAVYKEDRRHVYSFVNARMREGRQCYVVCPLIEESEKIEAKSAEELFAEMKKLFPDRSVAMIHGAMKQEEKDAIMSAFARGDIDLLVSTVVIEVGINVKNATVMVIENCERFGLAQMHQLRGRVGRGDEQSYCYLVMNKESEIAKERARIMTETTDGFVIAEEDLKLRGPGEIFGTRQHGTFEMHLADVVKHVAVLERAKESASKVLELDPSLSSGENAGLRARIEKLFKGDIRLEI